MICDVQQDLLKEEARAWAAYKELKDSGSKDKEEMLKRADSAGLATSRLREHLFTCRKCKVGTFLPTSRLPFSRVGLRF